MAVPMANGPPFATLNHVAADLGIPNESEPLRVGIRCHTHLPSVREISPRAATPFQPCDRGDIGRTDTAYMSDRPDFTARDLHLVPVELSHDEAIEPLVVGAAVVAQEPERLLLADEEAAHAVGAVMDAGGVAAERDVGGQLVGLISEGESGAPPELPRGAICRGLHRVRQNVIHIEESF